MVHRNPGLILLLLVAVVGHASLLEALTQRQEPYWHIGIALCMAPLPGMLLGGFLAEDGRRAGHGVVLGSAALHLALDAASLALLWLRPLEWRAGVLTALVGAAAAAWVLRGSLRALRPPPGGPGPPRPLPPLLREVHLLGPTALTVTAVSAGFVLLALWASLRRPERAAQLIGPAAFFALCGAVGVFMGLQRRAALLGEPSPRLWPSRWRLVLYRVAREGLVQRDQHGVTLIPWHAMERVELGEVHHSPAVLLWLCGPAERRWRPGASPQRQRRWAPRWERTLRWNRGLLGVDLFLQDLLCEGGAGPLADDLARGLVDPASRARHPTVEELLAGRTAGVAS